MPDASQNDRSPDTSTFYVWLSRDADGIEGTCAMPAPDGCVMPLVFTDRRRAERVGRPFAQLAARHRGFPARLVRFERVEILEEIQP